MRRAVVTGAGGFIGRHLVAQLKRENWWVRAMCHSKIPSDLIADEVWCLDLKVAGACEEAVRGVDYVFQGAALMGGIGFTSKQDSYIATENALINANMLRASADATPRKRFLLLSTACVYPAHNISFTAPAYKEGDAIPANPQGGYGWEKLFAEQLCEYYDAETRLDTRVARLHTIYGRYAAYEGGREKVVGALCRKVAMARPGDDIKVWGSGLQQRTYCHVDDAVRAIEALMLSECWLPVNISGERSISVNDLLDAIITAAGKTEWRLRRVFDTQAPSGAWARGADISRAKGELGWEPRTSLGSGIADMYRWVRDELQRAGRIPSGA